MFKVFNPLTGLHEDAADAAAARSLQEELVAASSAHFLATPMIPGRYRFDPAWAADFDLAFAFYCAKHDVPVTDALAQGGSLPLLPAHSVYNTTTDQRWSNTFAYMTASGKMRHIKVHDAQITDWYEHQGQVGEQTYEWVAFDLESGEPIEVYEFSAPRTLTKRNLIDPSLETVSTTFLPLSEMPEFVQLAVQSLPHKETIDAYSEKSYGLIVEYHPPHLVPAEQWPDDIKAQHATLLEQASIAAQTTAKELVKVVSVSTDELGYETWEAVDFVS